jgi:hypothetical protein
MLPKYISPWLSGFFLIWLFGYIFNIKIIINNINPYYTSILLLIGFIIIDLYNIIIRKYRYEYSFLFIKIMTHCLPLILSYYLLKNKRKNALINLIIIVILYIIYIKYIDRDIYDTYFVHKAPSNWKEYLKLCKSKEGKYIPYCFLFKDT